MLGQQQRAARSDGGAFVDPYLIGARSTTCANAQAFPTNGANCKDSICNNPKLVLGSYVKGPNNKICREWVERLGFGHRTVVSHGFHSNLHEGEPDVSYKTCFQHDLSGSGP